MTTPQRPAVAEAVPALSAVRSHLARTGWTFVDDDGRTTLWRWERDARRLVVVLPSGEWRDDEPDRLNEALRTIAFSEDRTIPELISDLSVDGGADTLAVRFTPEAAPAGKAPLNVAQGAVNGVHDLVVGSAAALDVTSLVLPSRRPLRAEAYAAQSLLSTTSGSFVVSLVLPLLEATGTPPTATPPTEDVQQGMLIDLPPQPYGRRVALRMRTAVQRSVALAEKVGDGDRPLREFAEPVPFAANATELAALAALGGPDHGRYQMRFSQAPGAGPEGTGLLRLAVSPAQQRVLAEAADFLRTRQPRTGVTVTGLVVRLFRTGNFGTGEAVVQGEGDDSGTQRRYRIALGEQDYNEAVRAHREGLQVIATGDLEFAGTRASLRRLTGFAVLPGLD